MAVLLSTPFKSTQSEVGMIVLKSTTAKIIVVRHHFVLYSILAQRRPDRYQKQIELDNKLGRPFYFIKKI